MLYFYATSLAHLALLFAFPETQLEILFACLRINLISIDFYDKRNRRLYDEPTIHFFIGGHALAVIVLGFFALIGVTKIFHFELTMFFVDLMIMLASLVKLNKDLLTDLLKSQDAS